MISHFFHLKVAAALILTTTTAGTSLKAQSSKLNKSAQALAKVIAPKPPAKSNDEKALAALSDQMTKAIEILEESYRSNGPTPANLIGKALSFRKDIGKAESLVLTNSLLEAWRASNAMGLVNDRGEFEPEITKGRGIGEKTLFELIIPGETYPPASNQLANVRLVRLDEKRVPGSPLNPREIATGRQLKTMIEERLESIAIAAHRKGEKTNDLGQTEKEQLELWNAAMKEAGDAAKEMPSIRLRGDMTAGPSNLSDYRWRVTCEVANASIHPTDVTAEIWLVGYTHKKRQHFIMSKTSQSLKLRPGQTSSFDVYSKSKNSYKAKADDLDQLSKKERLKSEVNYRGFMMKVTHSKGVAAFTASDQRLLSYIDPGEENPGLAKLPTF